MTKAPSTSEVKQKRKYRCRTKTIYLKQSSFSHIGKCDDYFDVAIRFLFLQNWIYFQSL